MKLVTAKTFYDSPTAWIALNQLESEGIKAFMENETLVQNAWELGEAAGQIRLKVTESDFEKACEILMVGSTVDLAELDKLAMESRPEVESKPLFQRFYPDEFEEAEELRRRENDEDSEGLEDAAEEEKYNARELLIDRAFRGALFSFFFAPLAMLVAYLLFQIFIEDEPIRPKYRKKLILACVFHVPFLITMLILLRFLFQPMN